MDALMNEHGEAREDPGETQRVLVNENPLSGYFQFGMLTNVCHRFSDVTVFGRRCFRTGLEYIECGSSVVSSLAYGFLKIIVWAHIWFTWCCL